MSFTLRSFALALFISAGAFCQSAAAQTLGTVVSPILTIESERFFAESAFGKRVAAELEAESAVLAAENRKIEAELTAEEKALTDKRPTMAPEDFRLLAEAFDEKVQNIRRTQSAKTRALSRRSEEDRVAFLNAAGPVLEGLMREAQAAVILERRSVFIGSNAIDVTDDAIRRMDEELGDGSSLPQE